MVKRCHVADSFVLSALAIWAGTILNMGNSVELD
jgi:hypothetical protein